MSDYDNYYSDKVDLTAEHAERLSRFRTAMDRAVPEWETSFIFDRMSQFYFTGTIQDSILVIKRGGKASLFVRRDLDRAKRDSTLENIYPMVSFRDAAHILGAKCGVSCFDTEAMSLAALARLQKYFEFSTIKPLDSVVMSVRAKKSEYELSLLKAAGKAHAHLFQNIVPALFRENMSEADLYADLYAAAVRLGHHGVTRFTMLQSESILGEIAFSENSLLGTYFDSPGGNAGMCAAIPPLGSRSRRLRRGDNIFVDTGFGIAGYHTDKTQLYYFGNDPPKAAVDAYWACHEIMTKAAEMLRPGVLACDVYNQVINPLSYEFKENFMGFGNRSCKFLGHGIGLNIDEMPVLASGCHMPLQEGMVVAIEPKKGILEFGCVGVEETYIVTKNGGLCITGGANGIVVV